MTRRQRARFVFDALRKVIRRPQTELKHVDEYELVVAVMLSAQCTDERVNKVTPALFDAFPGFTQLASAEVQDVLPFIKSVTYPNTKSKHLVDMARMVRNEYGGHLPDTAGDLMRLPGVGRKSAEVILAVAFNKPALAVDTHVFRVANRTGLAQNATTALSVERQLKRLLPVEQWADAHHLLILHGRHTCTSQDPACGSCVAANACRYYERLSRLPVPRDNLDSRCGRFFCGTCRSYFDQPKPRTDRYGLSQIACVRCRSMNVFSTRNGRSSKRIPDYKLK